MKPILAIDPGAGGGIVAQGIELFYCDHMPETEGDVVNYLRAVIADNRGIICVIEDQTGCAGIRVSAPAMFKFGRGFGHILGVLGALGVRVETVRPQVWQKELGLGTRAKGMSKTEWKNKLKAKAQQLFPTVHVTLATADALLLLEYARRKSK